MDDDLKHIICLLLLLIIAVPVIFGLAYYVGEYKCKAQAEIMQVNYNYGIITSCMVETTPNKYVPLISVRP